jgi:hypothetical protein
MIIINEKILAEYKLPQPTIRRVNLKDIQAGASTPKYIYCGRGGHGFNGELGNPYINGTDQGMFWRRKSALQCEMIHAEDIGITTSMFVQQARDAVTKYNIWFTGANFYKDWKSHNVPDPHGLYHVDVKELLLSHCISMFRQGVSDIILATFARKWESCHTDTFQTYLLNLLGKYPELYLDNLRLKK